MKKERIAYIDFIEFIAVFLVVFCHYTETAGTTVVDNIALQFTTTIAVPLFFMANGALLFSQKFNWKKHLVKIVMLFVSTAVWKLLTLVVVYLDMGYHFHDLTVSYVFQGICGGNFSDPPVPVEHFWFMYELIGIYLLFPLLKGCYDAGRKDILIYIAAICFFFVCVLTEYNAFAGLFADKFGIDIVTLSGSEFPFAKGGAVYHIFYCGSVYTSV